MADNRKYYYMRLMENYFEMNEQLYLESLPDGYLYSNILLKLYLRSLERDGLLMFNDRTPYNPQMIAHMTRHPVEVVERALRLFEELGIIEVQENGAMYMLDMQSFVGKTSTLNERKREYRRRIRDGEQAEDAAADAPVDMPVYAAADIPEDAAVYVPVDMPVYAAEDAAADAPVDMPVYASADIPADIPVYAAMDMPVDIPADIPVDAAMDMPVDIPVDAPQDMPGTPCETNRWTNEWTNVLELSHECPPEIETESELKQETERELGYGRVTGISLSAPAREESGAAACPVEAEGSGDAAPSVRPGGCWVSATVSGSAASSARPATVCASDGSASGGDRAVCSAPSSARPATVCASDGSASGGGASAAASTSARPVTDCASDGVASGGGHAACSAASSARPATVCALDGAASGGGVSASAYGSARQGDGLVRDMAASGGGLSAPAPAAVGGPASGSEYVPARELTREERDLVNAWNTLGIQRLTYNMPPEVRRAFDVLVSQHRIPEIRAVIEKMRDCYYLLGVNKTGWTATISWMANPDNFRNVKAGVFLAPKARGNAVCGMRNAELIVAAGCVGDRLPQGRGKL